jgi:alpha-glucuronidase
MRILLSILCLLIVTSSLRADDGYRLWLRYNLIQNDQKLTAYKKSIKGFVAPGNSATHAILKKELQLGINSLLGVQLKELNTITASDQLLLISKEENRYSELNLSEKLKNIGTEGFAMFNATINGKKIRVVAAHNATGLLYGTFQFLRLLQTEQDINTLNLESSPKIKLRILNHWDNLDRTVERGYAGFSLWDWHRLPNLIDARYTDYARANASIGINGTVLTNVNANALILTPEYLQKVKALADHFRPYGIRVYLTARFSAPIDIGGLKTADPLDNNVKQWWSEKVREIYRVIPDFGGFLVKANSEGQPGPQNYGRSHADGANMLADALQPYHGIVMWRAFVYDNNVPDDRAKQAYNEFKPLDGKFRNNVLVQVKNGPIDFQPREPFHPLFGAMPKTPLMMEFQLTQEYLGFSTHIAFLPTLFKECLDADTKTKSKNSTVAEIIDGSTDGHELSGIAGVANTGTDRNWCGHPFAQANWYGFGRLAWDHTLSEKQIADEWTRMTFTNKNETVTAIKSMLLASREIVVNYMTPLGLHHIMGWNHHYGPGPWIKDKPRADWTSVYYHQADTLAIGFNRTRSGSNSLTQYSDDVQKLYGSLNECPENYLLWFHHVSWDHKLRSGKTLWEEMCYKYSTGVDSVRWMQKTWNSTRGTVNPEQFEEVKSLLNIQEKEAVWWRNSCLLYFQTFSRKQIPQELEKPEHTLEYYQKLSFPYAPGIRPSW